VARFLVDECVPRNVVDAVRALGHDAVLVRDVIQGASDEDVLRFAQGERRIMLTEDRRFGLLAMNSGASTCGVIVMTLDQLSPAQRARRLSEVLPTIAADIAGSVIVIGATRVRRRPL
jgi:predicted nuclease of predicted toxin-antitoxin system